MFENERRKFQRLQYVNPLSYKVCKEEIISRLLKGYTANISQAGILCKIKDKVKEDDILWLSFDRATLDICEELEKMTLIYQGGVIGKVVRVENKNEDEYEVGVRFITREEQNLTHIYPKIHFTKNNAEFQDEEN